eukprot:TRINITY_DN11989_c0_g1_i1.p1 TRINITY_DN11989_c0_g1~~TRINITY_DN11989_c0_g1_i1.p1  ORF type:complete len:345 (+),score=72.36 TRINITY_DN11989_c0_g1_i1:70-1035(+)
MLSPPPPPPDARGGWPAAESAPSAAAGTRTLSVSPSAASAGSAPAPGSGGPAAPLPAAVGRLAAAGHPHRGPAPPQRSPPRPAGPLHRDPASAHCSPPRPPGPAPPPYRCSSASAEGVAAPAAPPPPPPGAAGAGAGALPPQEPRQLSPRRVSPSRRWPELAAMAQRLPPRTAGDGDVREAFVDVVRGRTSRPPPRTPDASSGPGAVWRARSASPCRQGSPNGGQWQSDWQPQHYVGPTPQHPGSRPAGPARRRNVFDRLLDPRSFTGTHKHRFDRDTGKGLGTRGRDEGPKGRGNEGRGTVHGGSRINWAGCLRSGSFGA